MILVSLLGVGAQLSTIWRRKRDPSLIAKTELLSLNQFSVSFLAYFSFFVYGFTIKPFNHFIVWPRLVASMLVLIIIYEIWKDRNNIRSGITFVLASFVILLGIAGLVFGQRYSDEGRIFSTTLIVVVSLFLTQGYYHQIQLIIQSGRTGAVDIRMSQFILAMDCSTILFAFSMGFKLGWPLMFLAVSSGITKLIIMYLFRWVRISEAARVRRAASESGVQA